MLKRAKILIVEDEAMIATHLAVLVEDHNGEVVGLAGSVAEALDLLATGIEVDGAVLDGNLGDGDVTPVALLLVAGSVPVVIYSGVGIPADLALTFPGLPVVLKPTGANAAISILANQIEIQNKPTLRT
jgi:DNA-binding NarL/FixJ family response regulator